jgi:hypothetical protein
MGESLIIIYPMPLTYVTLQGVNVKKVAMKRCSRGESRRKIALVSTSLKLKCLKYPFPVRVL